MQNSSSHGSIHLEFSQSLCISYYGQLSPVRGVGHPKILQTLSTIQFYLLQIQSTPLNEELSNCFFFKYHHNFISSLAIEYDVIMCIWSPHKSLTPLYVTKIIGFELCFRPILFLFVYLFLPFCPLFLDQRIFISVLSGIHLTFIPHPLSVQSSDSSLIIFLFLRKSESWTWHMYW